MADKGKAVLAVGGLGLALLGGYLLTRKVEAAPDEFEVSDLVISPYEVQIGYPVSISCLVENIGTETGSKTIIGKVEGTIMAEETVILGPGESQVVSFEVTPEVAKIYSVSVDGLYGSFVATEVGVAVFSVALGVSNMTPDVHEVIQGWVDITNIGTATGTTLIEWFKDGVVLTFPASVTLAPGETKRSYSGSFSFATPGDHVLEVVADSASDSVTITVLGEAVADIRVENLVISPTDPMVGEIVTISVTVTNYGTATGSKTIVCTVT